uniref:Uncharacterized protein n=1 Tax=viral metagenome TaxID=1070528 RepID=A0A6C0LQV1_9ZZZZ
MENKIKIIILITVLIIIMIGILIYYIIVKKKGKIPPEEKPIKDSKALRYLFGKACPTNFNDLGRIGMLIDKDSLDNIPFDKGANYSTAWTWVHPHMCKGNANDENLYKFSATQDTGNLGKGGILWQTKNGNVAPFSTGSKYADSTWEWTHPYIVPSTSNSGYYISESDSPGAIGPVGFLWENESLGNIGKFEKESAYNNLWTWVNPYLSKAK